MVWSAQLPRWLSAFLVGTARREGQQRGDGCCPSHCSNSSLSKEGQHRQPCPESSRGGASVIHDDRSSSQSMPSICILPWATSGFVACAAARSALQVNRLGLHRRWSCSRRQHKIWALFKKNFFVVEVVVGCCGCGSDDASATTCLSRSLQTCTKLW